MKIDGERVALWTIGILLTVLTLLVAAGLAADVFEYWVKALATARALK
jgi:hypothetical protein